MAQLLVDHGAHADAHDKYFRTALHRAVTTGAEDCVEMLLQARGDPTMRYTHAHTSTCDNPMLFNMLRVQAA